MECLRAMDIDSASTLSESKEKSIEEKLSSPILGGKQIKKTKKVSRTKILTVLDLLEYDKHSTPDPNVRNILSYPNLSLSWIESGSSSSDSKEKIFEKKIVSNIRRKTNRKKEENIEKKTIACVASIEKTDSDWETAEESSRISTNKDVTSAQHATPTRNVSSPSVHLFEDERSSETVHGVAIEHERLLNNSPIIKSFRCKQVKPINLSPVETQRDDNLETSDKDELILYRQNNVRTYPGRVQKYTEKLDSTEILDPQVFNFLCPGTFSLPSLSDILWDEFIAKHQEELKKTQDSAQASTSSLHPAVPPKSKDALMPQDTTCDRGYRNEILREQRRRIDSKDSDSNDETRKFFKHRRLTNTKAETHVKEKTKSRVKGKTAK